MSFTRVIPSQFNKFFRRFQVDHLGFKRKNFTECLQHVEKFVLVCPNLEDFTVMSQVGNDLWKEDDGTDYLVFPLVTNHKDSSTRCDSRTKTNIQSIKLRERPHGAGSLQLRVGVHKCHKLLGVLGTSLNRGGMTHYCYADHFLFM